MLEVLICAKFQNKNKKIFIAGEKIISKNSNIKTPQMTNKGRKDTQIHISQKNP